MKKSLLTISYLIASVVFICCHSHTKSGNSTATGSVKKDSVKSGNNTAIHHGAPNQAQLDSIVKARTNEKNKK